MFIARGLRDARFGSELNSKFDHVPNRNGNLEIVDGQTEHASDWMGETHDDTERLFNALPFAHAPSTGGANRIMPSTPAPPPDDTSRKGSSTPSPAVPAPPTFDTDTARAAAPTVPADRRLCPKQTLVEQTIQPHDHTHRAHPAGSHRAYLVFSKDWTYIKDAPVSGDQLLRAFLAGATGDPSNHHEAMRMNESGWRPAELAEIQNHLTNQSWTEIDASEVPHGRRLVRMTWAYKTKRSGKLKARLCIQGCSQIPGIDYDQTFCATLRHSARTMCRLSQLGTSYEKMGLCRSLLARKP